MLSVKLKSTLSASRNSLAKRTYSLSCCLKPVWFLFSSVKHKIIFLQKISSWVCQALKRTKTYHKSSDLQALGHKILDIKNINSNIQLKPSLVNLTCIYIFLTECITSMLEFLAQVFSMMCSFFFFFLMKHSKNNFQTQDLFYSVWWDFPANSLLNELIKSVSANKKKKKKGYLHFYSLPYALWQWNEIAYFDKEKKDDKFCMKSLGALL